MVVGLAAILAIGLVFTYFYQDLLTLLSGVIYAHSKRAGDQKEFPHFQMKKTLLATSKVSIFIYNIYDTPLKSSRQTQSLFCSRYSSIYKNCFNKNLRHKIIINLHLILAKRPRSNGSLSICKCCIPQLIWSTTRGYYFTSLNLDF